MFCARRQYCSLNRKLCHTTPRTHKHIHTSRKKHTFRHNFSHSVAEPNSAGLFRRRTPPNDIQMYEIVCSAHFLQPYRRTKPTKPRHTSTKPIPHFVAPSPQTEPSNGRKQQRSCSRMPHTICQLPWLCVPSVTAPHYLPRCVFRTLSHCFLRA